MPRTHGLVFFAACIALAHSVSPITCALADDLPWFRRHLVGMEVGPTGAQFGHSDRNDTRYCSKFDGSEIVRRCVAAHAEYLVLWARDGDYAYYDSKLLPKAPGLAARDPLREAVAEAKRHKLPVIAYCVVQQSGHFLKAHPEFEMRGSDGKPLGRFCFNSGYLEAMKQIVAEQLAYGIDGFHIDMLDQGFGAPYGCWCDTCRGLFEKEFGHPMPKGVTWDDAWDELLAFRYRTSESFEKKLAAHIKSIDPGATVDFNYHGNPPFSFEVGQRPVQHAGNSDFVTGETGVWGFSALTVGLNAEFYRASTPGQPFQVAIQRGVRMYHDQTTRPLADIRWELFTLLAHGAFVTVVDKTGFDGGLDPVAYDRVGEAFQEALAKRSHFGQASVQDVGIYFSSRSRDWLGREKPMHWMRSFLGAHKACVYEHIPFGVVLDENASLEVLQRYPVIVLPNVGIVSPDEVQMFRSYVEAGGHLIVSGHTGQFDRMGRPHADSIWNEFIGVKAARQLDAMDAWVRFPKSAESEAAFRRHLRPDWPLLVEGPATVYEVTSARPLGELLKPHRAKIQEDEWPMSADAPVGPAVLVRQIGKGMLLTFAASPDFATASEHHTVEARRLLTNAIRQLLPKPRVQVDAPTNVEAVISDDRGNRRLRVHFIAYNSTPQTLTVKQRPYVIPGLIEDAPTFRARITTLDTPKAVSALNPATELKQRGNQVDVLIDDIHEVVLIDY